MQPATQYAEVARVELYFLAADVKYTVLNLLPFKLQPSLDVVYKVPGIEPYQITIQRHNQQRHLVGQEQRYRVGVHA